MPSSLTGLMDWVDLNAVNLIATGFVLILYALIMGYARPRIDNSVEQSNLQNKSRVQARV